jgi:hypothetical protein
MTVRLHGAALLWSSRTSSALTRGAARKNPDRVLSAGVKHAGHGVLGRQRVRERQILIAGLVTASGQN